jgi:hypothetical protein
MEFTSPTTGVENDWVLVIDDATKNFKEPGNKCWKHAPNVEVCDATKASFIYKSRLIIFLTY